VKKAKGKLCFCVTWKHKENLRFVQKKKEGKEREGKGREEKGREGKEREGKKETGIPNAFLVSFSIGMAHMYVLKKDMQVKNLKKKVYA